jgi:hypothetical protein
MMDSQDDRSSGKKKEQLSVNLHPGITIGHTARQTLRDYTVTNARVIDHQYAPETIAAFFSVFSGKPCVVA